ncbi:SH3 domain-containing protein [Hymenobacter algoricola]|uniref:SH3 domain-containing protein n=1 Tax=Hymenobacter algoricola TaxID=486267 RepID=UPI003CD08BD7
MRYKPVAKGPVVQQFGRNATLTVIEIVKNNWALVRYNNEDVSVGGYVSKWYLSEKKHHE